MSEAKPAPPPKPLPNIGEKNRPFWEATAKGELQMQRCDDCGHYRYPISDWCPRCLSENYTWTKLSGRGEVFSAVTFYQVYHPAYRDDVPYNSSMIQLEEGPRMFSNVVGVPPDEVKVGDKVHVVFDKINDEVTMPRFEKD